MKAFHVAFRNSDCEKVVEIKCKTYIKNHTSHLFILQNLDSLHVILNGMVRLSSTIFDMVLEMM